MRAFACALLGALFAADKVAKIVMACLDVSLNSAEFATNGVRKNLKQIGLVSFLPSERPLPLSLWMDTA